MAWHLLALSCAGEGRLETCVEEAEVRQDTPPYLEETVRRQNALCSAGPCTSSTCRQAELEHAASECELHTPLCPLC